MSKAFILNKYIEKDGVSYLLITNLKTNTITTVLLDREDIEKCKKYKWVINKQGYVEAVWKRITLHRYVLDYNGDLLVDHINRNRLDNRKNNLRIATLLVNNQNNSCPGVSFDKHAGKWKAEYSRFGKAYYAGIYNTKEQAIEARAKAILETEKESESLLKEFRNRDKNHLTGIQPSAHGKWTARYCSKGKIHYIGTYKTKEEAFVAREEYIKLLNTGS